jgi:uroporphyrinogen III methyltransferase/synthase
MATERKQGVVYLVGSGPGTADLITMRGMRLLASADAVVYDYLADPQLLREIPPGCEVVYVGKKAGQHTLRQEEINDLLVKLAEEGKRVVRLKGGDPFVFGRGGEEALALKEAGQPFEVVPGVTAGIAAPAYAGIPVTHRGMTCTLGFITGHEDPEKDDSDIDWSKVATGFGTLVFYMGVGNLPRIVERLIENGRAASTPAAVIRWGCRPNQQTVSGTLTDIAQKVEEAGLKPPAIIIVGEVVGLRSELQWFENKPLFGQRIVVTRSRAQAGDLALQLTELGADVVEFPVIRIAAPEDAEPLKQAAGRVGEYDWLVFMSVNGVEAFFEALRGQGLDARALHGVRVCAIGPTTASAVERYGVVPDLMPPKYVAESVAEALMAQGAVEGKRFLLARADIGRSFLPRELERLGAQVEDVVAYRTVLEEPENIEEVRCDLQEGRISAVTFSSSSTVRNFAELVGADVLRNVSPEVCLASIGPETTRTLREWTDAGIAEAAEYTIPGLVALLIERLPGKV